MSNKTNNNTSKASCKLHVYSKTPRSLKSDDSKNTKPGSHKKVVRVKKPTTPKDGKSCSTGIINGYKKPPVVKPKKTTKSEVFCNRKVILKKSVDFCKKCGDVIEPTKTASSNVETELETLTDLATLERDICITEKFDKILEKVKSIPKDLNQPTTKILKNVESKSKSVNIKEPVQQYYKNENFRLSSESAHAMENVLKKISSLDTIKEVPEIQTLVESQKSSNSNSINMYFDSDSDNANAESYESIKQLREFRKKNYFECHSSKSRIESKSSATSLKNHKCMYRFYLNDRLFPVPLYADRHKNIRCIECHLPLELDKERPTNSINGTIQAKVKFGSGDETQDMLLMLPVKEPLIIKEKRKERKKIEKDVMYFGVIKLSSAGYSVFNQNLPADSLALKYQKGYQEFDAGKDCKYERMDKGDVIII